MSGAASDTAAPLATIVGLSVAAGLVPLNSTMIAVALPAISDDFDVSTAEVSVLITAYLVIMLVGQPLAGRLADALGSRRTVQAALVGLAVFSGLAAIASSFPMLLVARSLQAVCATALGPGIQSILRTLAASSERGRVFGIFGSTMGTGAAAGPVIGGVLVALFDWRAIFVVNVPIALLAVVAVGAVRLRTEPTAAAADGHGSKVSPAPDATTGRILNSVFVSGFATQALTTQAQYALLLLTPLVLDARGWDAGSIGLVLAALTVGMILTGPAGGRIGDAVGPRLPALAGVAVAGGATAVLAIAGELVAPLVLVLGLAAFGVGFGVTAPNAMSASLGSVPADRTGAAAGIFTTSRYVGSISTTILIATFVADDASGTRTVLAISVGCLVAALGVVRWLPGGHAASADPASVSGASSPHSG